MSCHRSLGSKVKEHPLQTCGYCFVPVSGVPVFLSAPALAEFLEQLRAGPQLPGGRVQILRCGQIQMAEPHLHAQTQP